MYGRELSLFSGMSVVTRSMLQSLAFISKVESYVAVFLVSDSGIQYRSRTGKSARCGAPSSALKILLTSRGYVLLNVDLEDLYG